MLVNKIKLFSEIYDNRLVIKCKPISTKMENPDNADILTISLAISKNDIKSIVNFISYSMLISKFLTAPLNEILNKLYIDKLYEILDGFLSFEDPLYNHINQLLTSEYKEELYLAYFTKESLESLKIILEQYIKDVINDIDTSEKIYKVEIP